MSVDWVTEALTDAERERAYWDATAASENVWGELWSIPGMGWEEGIEACLAQIEPILHGCSAGRVLELGCGIGRLLLPLAEHWSDMSFIGVDCSAALLTKARAATKSAGLGNVRYIAGDGRNLPRSLPARFQAAYSVLTFQHVPPEAQSSYLSQIAAKLDAGGLLRLQFVQADIDHFLSHGIPPETMAQWCAEAGLTVVALDRGVIDESWAWITATKL
jgi:cyclopropane fatty-acyl-phospholipid synthase-like methyltransferase